MSYGPIRETWARLVSVAKRLKPERLRPAPALDRCDCIGGRCVVTCRQAGGDVRVITRHPVKDTSASMWWSNAPACRDLCRGWSAETSLFATQQVGDHHEIVGQHSGTD